MKLTTKHKHGVSLIAVLMFMLAATTASVVVFQWVSQENVASGTRLKMSEAHQASQAGLEAVQGWLTNKGADVGALMRTFEHNNKKSVELSSNLLGSIKSNRQQNFKVYLTDIDTRVQPYKLKFLSVGTSRNDESKHSQAGIFEVAGLYKMSVSGWYHNGIVPSAPQLPEFYGKVGSGTQGLLSSGYITGDLNTTQGFSSTGDLLITGIADMASGAIIGCPLKPGSSNEQVNPSNDSRPSPYNPELYGNYYVKENHTSHGIGFCGKVYAGANFNVKGQTVIWGDLYVKGDLNITNSLRIHGNLTVEGDIIFSGSSFSVGGNLVMLNSDSKFKIEADQNVRIYGSSWIAGDLTRSVNNNNKLEFCSNTDNDGLAKNGDLLYIGPTDYNDYTNNCSTPNSPTGIPPFGGAEPLDYLGDQITKEKVNGKYTIPDPIVLGIANNEWKTRNIHETSCTALRSFANADGVIEIDSETNASLLMDAINACPSNWTGADKTPWLVLRMYWGGINLFQDQVFRKDVIIVVENKPTAMDLPMTLSNTNVLLWLTKGSGTIFIRNTSIGNRARNYFIYSEDDINTIDGSQYLRGNIFMANGKSVGAMQDPTMQANPELYAALAAAGIIIANPDRCAGTGLDDGNGGCINENEEESNEDEEDIVDTAPIGNYTPGGIDDPSTYYVPTLPHLRVKLQSQYTNEEAPNSPMPAEEGILVMPRVVYVKLAEAQTGDHYIGSLINVLYLNDATPPPSLPLNLSPICPNFTGNGAYVCHLTMNELSNPFYVVVGDVSSGNSASPNNPESPGTNPDDETGDEPENGTEDGNGSTYHTEHATCVLINKDGENSENITVTQGEKIRKPRIICSNNGMEANTSSAEFLSSKFLPSRNNWRVETGNVFYPSDADVGSSIITVENVSCGDIPIYDEIYCGTINVQRPTCSIDGPVYVGNMITPNVGCGNDVPVGNRTFYLDNYINAPGWNSSNSGSFSSASSGRQLSLRSVECDGNTINISSAMSVKCGDPFDVEIGPCDYDPTWCPGVAWNDIKWGVDIGDGTKHGDRACFARTHDNQGPTCGSHCIKNRSSTTGVLGGIWFVYLPTNTEDNNYYGPQNKGSTVDKPTTCTDPCVESNVSRPASCDDLGLSGGGGSSNSESSSSSAPSSSSESVIIGPCGSNEADHYHSLTVAVGNCIDLTNNCTSDNNLPLKIYNYNQGRGGWQGTIYCSDNTSKMITCAKDGESECSNNACAAGTNSAFLSITSITGDGGSAQSNCW